MTPEIRDRLLAEFDEVTRVSGGHTFAEGVDEVARICEKLLVVMNQMRTREQLAAVLDKEEITPEQVQLAFAALQILPQLFGIEMKRVAKSITKDFPVVPPGAKQLLSPQQQRKACAFMAELFANGVPLKSCRERAAQRFGVSVRTIERIWQSRARLAELIEKPNFETAKTWLFANLNRSSKPMD